jgi:small subunit ribosomal protein S6
VSDERRTRRYETMIVLRTDLQEAGVKEQAERVRKLLETQGAVVAGVHEWGLRELAYIIQKERRGYYLLAEYTGPAAAVAELERTLKLSDVILRFVTIRQDDDAPPAVAPQRDVETAPAIDEILPVDDDEDVVLADAEIGDVE